MASHESRKLWRAALQPPVVGFRIWGFCCLPGIQQDGTRKLGKLHYKCDGLGFSCLATARESRALGSSTSVNLFGSGWL